MSAPVMALAPETGEAPAPAAAGAETPPARFVALLARCSDPPGRGAARASGHDQATGARTAQSEGAAKDSDIAEPFAVNASESAPAIALTQPSLPAPPDGAQTHTDDAPEPAAGAHEARRSGAPAELAGEGGAAGAACLPAPQPQSQGAAAAGERPEAQPAGGTAAPPHAAALLGGTAAADAAGRDPAGARGRPEDIPLAVPSAAGSEAAAAAAGERALARLAGAAATTPQAQPPVQQQSPVAVASPQVATPAASDTPVATPRHPALSDGQVATPRHSAASDAPVATPTNPAASGLWAAQAEPGPVHSPQAPHPALAAPTAHARPAALPSTAAALVDVAVSARATRARIVLAPPELGTVEIRLRYGDGGVSATFHADSSQAAQTLALAAGDLRRALEAQGIQIQQIDVPATHIGQQAPAWSGGGDGDFYPGSGHDSTSHASERGGDPATLELDDPITHRAVLLGTAVDVLA